MGGDLRSLAAFAFLSAGMAMPDAYENFGPHHWPRPDLSYTHTTAPLTKRQRRRLRGKTKGRA